VRQVLHGQEATADVVHRDGVDSQVGDVSVDEHQRETAVDEAPQDRHFETAIDGVDDQAAGALADDAL
jgi:hypothetical protein